MPIRWLTVFLDHPGSTTGDRGEDFWLAVTQSTLSTRRGEAGEFATLLPRDGDAYLRFQALRDGAIGVHLDLHVEPGDHAATVRRAVATGAREAFSEPGLSVLRSPSGVYFCIVYWSGETHVPTPVPTPPSVTSRADQVCLSIDAADYDEECDFWSHLTGWTLSNGSLPEFRFLARPGGQPVRILLQRREHPSGATDAHIDVACSDRHAVGAHHVALGATLMQSRSHWLVMRDPGGRTYCLTARHPESGTLA